MLMKKRLVFKSFSILRGGFLASLLISPSLKAASSNVSSGWTLNEEPVVGEPAKDEVRIDIVFSQWIVGQTKPCGCSLSMRGGLEARERELLKIRPKLVNPLVLDIGNAFFPDEEQKKILSDKSTKKNKLIKEDALLDFKNAQDLVKAYKKWNLDAVVLATTELDKNNFEKTKDLLSAAPGFKVLSLSERAKAFSQTYFDKVVSNTGVRIIPLVNPDLEGASLPSMGSLFHKEYLNITVGDLTYKNLLSFETKLPKGNWINFGSNPDYPGVMPYKTEKFIRFIGATRKQDWKIVSLYLNPSRKTFRYKTDYIVTYFSQGNVNKKAQ